MKWNKDFANRESAQIYLDALIEKGPDWWCPLARQDCNPRCISFSQANLSKLSYGANKFRVNFARCDNYSIYGES